MDGSDDFNTLGEVISTVVMFEVCDVERVVVLSLRTVLGASYKKNPFDDEVLR